MKQRIFCYLFVFSIFSTVCFAEQTLLLSEGFDGLLTDNWVTGRSSDLSGSFTAAIVELQTIDTDYSGNTNNVLRWNQQFDFIETKNTYGNDVMIKFDVWGPNGTRRMGDFWIEFTALTDNTDYHAGIFGFRYGSLRGDMINIGRAPAINDSVVAEAVEDPPYGKDIVTDDPRVGTVTFVCTNGAVQMRFENEDGGTINSNWVSVSDFSSTKIRIWGYGGSGTERCIDNVRIYAPSGSGEISECKPKVVVIPLFGD